VKQLIWTDSARIGLAEILDPFAADRAEFIADALVQIGRFERLLITSPGIGSPLDENGQRKLRVGRTPIILIYRVDGAVLSIVRVHHSSQNWRK
jgi:toxin ParE1/3/4